MLPGNTAFIDKAATWRRRLGANPYTVMPYALSCRAAFRAQSHTFDARWRKLRALMPKLSQAAARSGGSLRSVPEVPQSCQVHVCIAAPIIAGAGAASGAAAGAGAPPVESLSLIHI